MKANHRVLGCIAACFALALTTALASTARATPAYMSADFAGGLFSVTSTMKTRLSAAGFDSSLFNCSSCADPTPVFGDVIFDSSIPIPGSGTVNVFSIGAIPDVDDAAIFEFNLDGISLHFGDAGVQGGPAFQYKNGVYNGFFFVDFFNSPNGTSLRFDVQGGTFSLKRTSDNANLFTGFLNVGANGLTNLENFTPTPSVPEPSTFALFGLGLAGLAFARRRKRK